MELIGASKSRRKLAADIIVFVILLIGAVAMLLPFAWMLSTSFKTRGQIFKMPPAWIPDPIVWTKYSEVLKKGEFLRGALNTVIVAVTAISFGTFTSALAAFAFAKMRFRYKNVIFMGLLGTMMLPFSVIMIPQYVLFTNYFGWKDTLLPLIVPAMFGNVSMIFFLRQNLTSISDSIIESAKIDGCGFFRIFIQIVLPLIKTAVTAQMILWFMFIWNDFLAPLIFLTTPEVKTLQIVIYNFNSFYAIQNDMALIMAASLIAMLPTLIVFLIFQKFIIKSIAITGIKG